MSVSCTVSLGFSRHRMATLLGGLTCMFVGPVGLEPTTYGLKVRSSAN